MKVCYVLSTSEIVGGANKSLIDLLKNIDRKYVEPYVLLRRHGNIENVLKELNIEYRVIPYINSVTTGNRIKDYFKKKYQSFGEQLIIKYLKSAEIQLIHNNSLPVLCAMEAAKKLNIPYVCHIRENVEYGLGVDFLDKEKHYNLIKNAAMNIVISNFIGDYYKNEIKGAKFITMYDGIDTDKYYLPRKMIFKENNYILAIYGNLDPQKGQLDAIIAMEKLRLDGYKNLALKIIGNSNTIYGKSVKKYVIRHNLENIFFIDPISNQKELNKSREEDDINLICSKAEGLGRVTIESMLSGCLTIAANSGASSEIIDDGNNGLLFDCGNTDVLKQIIEYAISHKTEMEIIANNGREYAKERYNIKKYCNEMIELYKQIAEE